MDEGIGIEELLEVFRIVPIRIRKGLAFTPNVGAKARGVSVHVLRQASIEITHHQKVVCI